MIFVKDGIADFLQGTFVCGSCSGETELGSVDGKLRKNVSGEGILTGVHAGSRPG